MLIVVGLRVMERDLGVSRSTLALAGAMTWVGTGLGGIVMGWLADRIGTRKIVLIGAVMIALGLALSSIGSVWALYLGQGVLIGFLGMGAIYPPLLIYVSRWFDRRRGTGIALISFGQYIAGVLWPAAFERLIAGPGWRMTYLGFGAIVLVGVVPLAALFLHPAPRAADAKQGSIGMNRVAAPRVLGLRPNVVQAILCGAGFCCCVPMAIPQAHLVAFCGDIGIGAATGAAMLSVMLGSAILSRQFWGVFADRHGGLKTVLAGSAFQAVAIGAFLLTQEAGLFVVAAVYGLGLRHHSGLCRGGPQPLSVVRGIVAYPARAVHVHERDGIRKLVRGTALRPLRFLRPGLRRWCRIQRPQPGAARVSGFEAGRTEK